MTESDSRLSLSDALCARLCHDLSSPIGTLIGSLDIMAEDPDSVAEALPLARDVVGGAGRAPAPAARGVGGGLRPGRCGGPGRAGGRAAAAGAAGCGGADRRVLSAGGPAARQPAAAGCGGAAPRRRHHVAGRAGDGGDRRRERAECGLAARPGRGAAAGRRGRLRRPAPGAARRWWPCWPGRAGCGCPCCRPPACRRRPGHCCCHPGDALTRSSRIPPSLALRPGAQANGRAADGLPDRDGREPRRARRRRAHPGARARRPGDDRARLPPGPHRQGHLRLPGPAAARTRGARRRGRARRHPGRPAPGQPGADQHGAAGARPHPHDRGRAGRQRQRAGRGRRRPAGRARRARHGGRPRPRADTGAGARGCRRPGADGPARRGRAGEPHAPGERAGADAQPARPARPLAAGQPAHRPRCSACLTSRRTCRKGW